MVFVRRGYCTFVEKVLKAQEAGAKGIVVLNNDNNLFQPASSEEKNDSWKFEIPCVLIPYENGVGLEKILKGEKPFQYIEENDKSIGGEIDNDIKVIKVKLLPHKRESATNIKTYDNNEELLTIHGHAIRNIRLNFNGK